MDVDVECFEDVQMKTYPVPMGVVICFLVHVSWLINTHQP